MQQLQQLDSGARRGGAPLPAVACPVVDYALAHGISHLARDLQMPILDTGEHRQSLGNSHTDMIHPGHLAVPQSCQTATPLDEGEAVEQFLLGLKSKALLKNVRAMWTIWTTGKFPTSVRAGVALPRGLSWRDMETAFEKKAIAPADMRYRKWRGKVEFLRGLACISWAS